MDEEKRENEMMDVGGREEGEGRESGGRRSEKERNGVREGRWCTESTKHLPSH